MKLGPLTLHERIAVTLGWSAADVLSFSLLSLRELVRPIDPRLAGEISARLTNPTYIARASV
jgi:hypothetical protein